MPTKIFMYQQNDELMSWCSRYKRLWHHIHFCFAFWLFTKEEGLENISWIRYWNMFTQKGAYELSNKKYLLYLRLFYWQFEKDKTSIVKQKQQQVVWHGLIKNSLLAFFVTILAKQSIRISEWSQNFHENQYYWSKSSSSRDRNWTMKKRKIFYHSIIFSLHGYPPTYLHRIFCVLDIIQWNRQRKNGKAGE